MEWLRARARRRQLRQRLCAINAPLPPMAVRARSGRQISAGARRREVGGGGARGWRGARGEKHEMKGAVPGAVFGVQVRVVHKALER
jgi:hypothetical protein